MAGVYIKLLMMESQEKNIQLSADLHQIEDMKSIEYMLGVEKGEGIQQENPLLKSKKFAESLAKNALGKGGNKLFGVDLNT